MNHIERLREIGFELAGEWKLSTTRPVFEEIPLNPHQGVLYAFVSGETVLYVGKTTRTLRQRMNGYRYPHETQRTNVNCGAKVAELLANGEPLQVFVRHQKNESRIGSFLINEAAALEDSIIREINPPWNRSGVSRRADISTNSKSVHANL